MIIKPLREPNATKLEREGFGYVVASVGNLSGEVPYTTFSARKSFISDNEDLINRFVKALNKGIKYVFENNEMDVAKVISGQFPSESVDDIATIIKRYKDSDSWYSNTYINEEAFKNLEDLMIDAKLINDYVPFNELVKNYDYE